MIHNTCIEIHTRKFPILEGENEELINEGMYGKALCQYIERELPKKGLQVPMYICEEWGWWIEVKHNDFVLGLQIYSDSEPDEDPEKYAVMSSISKNKKWSWRKFRNEDLTQQVTNIMDQLDAVFTEDPEIDFVKRHDDFPF